MDFNFEALYFTLDGRLVITFLGVINLALYHVIVLLKFLKID